MYCNAPGDWGNQHKRKRCLRPANGLEKRCFPDRNTKWKCRNACIAAGKSKESCAGCKTWGRQGGCFAVALRSRQGAYQSGAAAKRLKVGDGNISIAKCWGNVDRRREVSHGCLKERLGNITRGWKADRWSRLLATLPSTPKRSKWRGCKDAAALQTRVESFAFGARKDCSEKNSFSSLALDLKLQWLFIFSV